MIVSIEGHTPDVSSAAFVADNATVCGDVKVGEDSSIWFGAVLRASASRCASAIGLTCRITLSCISIAVFP